ncbi:uncharacterized protein LOC118206294 isoform X1 [Anguilla anguilla]|nr:uncharacterized protein LOC118206294 isoform X1 [Anguilla anguilla]XP_035234684.1 uncharacterized protein LOC118206294 isoform X1 [Anguilla anguilla]
METEANNTWNAEVKAGDDGNGAPSMAPTRVQCEGPEDGGKVQRWRVESVLGDQVVCRTFDSKTSAERHEPHSDYLSMIQISNVMSLVTSQDEVLPEEAATSAGKGREPEGGSPSTGSQGKDLAPCNEARRTSKLIWRNIDKLTDKLSWRSWVQRCLRNHVRTRQKWPNTGRRRALLCGKHFDQNMTVDQHVALADSARFLYRCGSCSMSFKAWTCLCRHIRHAHSVKIQRSSRTSPVAKANKSILKAKDKDIAEAFINNVKDASTDDQSQGRLINEPRTNSEMRKITIDGSPHLCLFAMKDIQKGEEIVFDHNGVDLPRCTSTQREKTHTLQDVPEITRNQKDNKEEHLSYFLAQKKEDLAAERRATATKISAIEEGHKAEIESLQADLQKQLIELRAENQKLVEELAAARIPPALATLPCHNTLPVKTTPSTPSKCSPSSWVKRQHPDMVIPELAPQRERKISQLSDGRPDRYGCYLFQAAVGTKKYHSWCCNTNWSGTAGKWELPRNLQEYLLNTLAEKFPGFGDRETRMFIERINELLRKPRQILYI